MNNIRFTTSAIAVTISMLIGLVDAKAVDNKTYPGAMCRAWWDPTPDPFYSYGVVMNRTSSGMTFVCPIVREYTGSGNSVAQFFVNGYDGSNDEAVECRLHSMAGNLTSGYTTQFKESGNNYTGKYELPLDPISSAYVWSRGFYVLFCEVPDKDDNDPNYSSIYTYSIGEN